MIFSRGVPPLLFQIWPGPFLAAECVGETESSHAHLNSTAPHKGDPCVGVGKSDARSASPSHCHGYWVVSSPISMQPLPGWFSWWQARRQAELGVGPVPINQHTCDRLTNMATASTTGFLGDTWHAGLTSNCWAPRPFIILARIGRSLIMLVFILNCLTIRQRLFTGHVLNRFWFMCYLQMSATFCELIHCSNLIIWFGISQDLSILFYLIFSGGGAIFTSQLFSRNIASE